MYVYFFRVIEDFVEILKRFRQISYFEQGITIKLKGITAKKELLPTYLLLVDTCTRHIILRFET